MADVTRPTPSSGLPALNVCSYLVAQPRYVPRTHVLPQIRFSLSPLSRSSLILPHLHTQCHNHIKKRCTSRNVSTTQSQPLVIYISPHPTAPDQVHADHPDHSDSVHIARYPCAMRRTRESSADIQVDLTKITQVVLALDVSLHVDRHSHSKSKRDTQTPSTSTFAIYLPDVSDRDAESHLFSTPFSPQSYTRSSSRRQTA
ncbi:hypothetical protein V8E55_007611 [Tylopilus felleus]